MTARGRKRLSCNEKTKENGRRRKTEKRAGTSKKKGKNYGLQKPQHRQHTYVPVRAT